jgi:hypothetical protein
VKSDGTLHILKCGFFYVTLSKDHAIHTEWISKPSGCCLTTISSALVMMVIVAAARGSPREVPHDLRMF